MMRPVVAALMLGVGILSCAPLSAGPAAVGAIARARQAVRVRLYDPGSARFRNVEASVKGDVCGQVDSRNIEGGHTGFARFVYDHRTRAAALALRDPDFRQFFIMDDNEYTNGNAAVIADDACRFVRGWVSLCPAAMARHEMHARALCALYDGGSRGRARLKRIVGAD